MSYSTFTTRPGNPGESLINSELTEHLRQAQRLINTGDFETAIEVLEEVRPRFSQSARLARALARANAGAGRSEQARWKYDEAIRLGADSANAYFDAAKARYDDEQFAGAAAYAEKVTEKEPGSYRGYYLWGLALVQQAKRSWPDKEKAADFYSKAAEEFGKTADLAAKDSELDTRVRACCYAGDSLREIGRLQEAAQCYLRALQEGAGKLSSTWRFDILRGLGDVLSDSQQYAEALRYYEQALETSAAITDNDKTTAWVSEVNLAMANAANQLKRYIKAQEHADKVLTEKTSAIILRVYAHLIVAASAASQANFAKAWKNYAKMHELYEKEDTGLRADAKAHLLETLGLVFDMIGEYKSAEQVLERACALPVSRKRASVWLVRTALCIERRDMNAGETAQEFHYTALEYARIAQRLLEDELEEKRSPEVLRDLGTLLVRFEDPERGEQLLREALTLSPDPAVQSALGSICAGRGEFEQAARYLRAAITADPGRFQDRVLLAEACRLGSALDVAENELRGLIALAPKHLAAQIALAETLIGRGDGGDGDAYAEAVKWLQQAVELSDGARVSSPRDRSVSEVLGPKRLSAALYAQGYALVKQYEENAGNHLFSGRDVKLLKQAEGLFARAYKEDPDNFRAKRAAERIRERWKGKRIGSMTEAVAPPLVALISVALLAAVQFAYFGNTPQHRIQGGYYATLTVSLLGFVAVAFYLPQILKLKVGTLEVEKAQTDVLPAAIPLTILRGASDPAEFLPMLSMARLGDASEPSSPALADQGKFSRKRRPTSADGPKNLNEAADKGDAGRQAAEEALRTA